MDTQNAAEAVILEGVAKLVTDPAIGNKLEPTSLSKYGMSGGDGSEPLYRVRPIRVFGLIEKSFPKTATQVRPPLANVGSQVLSYETRLYELKWGGFSRSLRSWLSITRFRPAAMRSARFRSTLASTLPLNSAIVRPSRSRFNPCLPSGPSG